MIQVRELDKTFGSFQALNGLALSVQAGSVHGFLGHNGAGKTTTLNILTGYSPYERGSVRIGGQEVRQAKKEVQAMIGYLPEAPQFYDYMRARELLTYLGRLQKSSKGQAVKRADALLDLVGLTGAAKRKLGGFSRGMKQRMGMACALVHDPQLLLLDEPTSALDPEGRREVLSLIGQLKEEGKTLLISTHILSDVERVCDSVTMIKEGRTILDADIETLKAIQGPAVYRIDFSRDLTAHEQAALGRQPFIDGLTCQDKTCTVKTPREDDAASLLLANALAGLNLPFHGIQRQERTLEELYIRRMNGHD